VAATIIDFKTDAVASTDQLADRYRPQLDAYRRGAAAALELAEPAVAAAIVSTALRRTVAL
jgi:ATP-dependent exoDNAse (exonuclease V) beta subunit